MVHIDTDLWHQRRRDRQNGNGNGNGHGGWQKWPWSAIVTVIFAIAGWITTSIVWAVKHDVALSAVEIRMNDQGARIGAMGTQLEDIQRRIGLMDERLGGSVQRNNDQDLRMERMEREGSRRIPIIEERQQQVIRRLDAIVQYLQSNSNFRLQ